MLASRTHWRLLTATIAVLMAAAFLAPHWVKPPDIQENRILAAKPAWPTRLQDFKAFRKTADAYVGDRFPIRPQLIGLLNLARMQVGVSGSNRVIIGRGGWLFFDDDSHLGAARNDPPMQAPEMRAWLTTLAGRTEAAQASGARYLIVAPPVKEVIYPEHAPSWFHRADPNRLAIALPKLAEAAAAGDVLYLGPAVAQATAAGQKTFSRHDTHWSGYGAYAGYGAMMRKLQAMGVTREGPSPLAEFPSIELTGVRLPRDLALMLGVSSFVKLDYPHLANPAAEAKIRTTFLGPKQDWTAPQVVDTGEVGKPVLLMTRDSFSNELLPFLYPHFSRIILTHIQDGFWRQDLIARFKPDIVILEVLEPGLKFAVGDGPPPSPQAAARINQVLGAATSAAPARPPAPATPPLAADPRLLAALDAAKPTPNCNLEVATLSPGVNGASTVSVSGWISELAPTITSPVGAVRLRGPAGDVTGPIRVDLSRPDVAAFFKVRTGEKSGFLGSHLVAKVPKGAYTPIVYRRSAGGWIACEGKQVLAVP